MPNLDLYDVNMDPNRLRRRSLTSGLKKQVKKSGIGLLLWWILALAFSLFIFRTILLLVSDIDIFDFKNESYRPFQAIIILVCFQFIFSKLNLVSIMEFGENYNKKETSPNGASVDSSLPGPNVNDLNATNL